MNTGSKIAGRYRIEGRLGVGGMSTVLLAVDERLERHVAVKLLAEHLADDATFVSRFRREALAAARLVHPNVVQVYDFGLDERAHQHFIVMEYVKGQSCAEILRDRGHLDVDQAVDIVTQACRGLDYAHRHGVVHRDVKPGNLMVSESGVVKLADFGIARATDQSSITQVGSVLGTAAYLSPEQVRGAEAGPQSDLYSLGVVTYQLLSGRLPYEATSLSELASKQQREPPTPLIRLNPTISPELSESVALTISVVAEERPQTAPEFAELIADGARGVSPWEENSRSGTSATRVLAGGDQSTEETQMLPRAAPAPVKALRTVPARRPEPVQEPGVDVDQVRGRRSARTAAWLLGGICVLVIAAVVVALVSHSNSGTVVHFHRIVAHDAQTAIDKVASLISQYTQK